MPWWLQSHTIYTERYVDTDAAEMRQRFGTPPAREQQARPLVTPAR
jgi:hypothetical protein